jgi:hypothetical protein
MLCFHFEALRRQANRSANGKGHAGLAGDATHPQQHGDGSASLDSTGNLDVQLHDACHFARRSASVLNLSRLAAYRNHHREHWLRRHCGGDLPINAGGRSLALAGREQHNDVANRRG